jgi:hypothetical protein
VSDSLLALRLCTSRFCGSPAKEAGIAVRNISRSNVDQALRGTPMTFARLGLGANARAWWGLLTPYPMDNDACVCR